jgi:hypothetical protein
MTLKHTLSIIFILSCWALQAQHPMDIKRASHVSILLNKKEKRVFKLSLSQQDLVRLQVTATKTINFRISNGAGQIINESIVKRDPYVWDKLIDSGGSFTIEIENISLFIGAEVTMKIDVQRPQFIYGAGDPTRDSAIQKVSDRKQVILTDGRFQITKASPKKYPYPLEKGDTLLFQLIPILGITPYVEITNDLNEIVFASLPSKHELNVAIPVLEKSTYTVSILTRSLFSKNFFKGMIDSLRIERISPPAYVKSDQAAEIAKALAMLKSDTVPEVFMDTVIYLGAIRDIIHPSNQTLRIQLDNSDATLYWGILFGAGQDFTHEVDQFQPLLQGNALAAGATDVLSAYGLGYLKKLPGIGNPDITFTASYGIQKYLMPGVRPNYALIHPGQSSTYFLSFENKSKSVGHNVYVKIILFKLMKSEP